MNELPFGWAITSIVTQYDLEWDKENIQVCIQNGFTSGSRQLCIQFESSEVIPPLTINQIAKKFKDFVEKEQYDD